MLNILPISALKDNYIWLVINTHTSQCLIVDPGDAKPVLQALKTHSLKPIGILLTHRHADHTNGVAELVENHTMPVFGSAEEAVPQITDPLVGGETVLISPINLCFQVLAIPGHTHEHLAYTDAKSGVLFCGDTLFTGGCGRVFEGTMEEMYHSLQRLSILPDSTQIYCGHEYTAANLTFALTVEPKNEELQQRIKKTDLLRQEGLPTVPSTLALEKATNPFLRCQKKSVKQSAEQHSGKKLSTPEEVFAVLREWKNNFST